MWACLRRCPLTPFPRLLALLFCLLLRILLLLLCLASCCTLCQLSSSLLSSSLQVSMLAACRRCRTFLGLLGPACWNRTRCKQDVM